MKLTSESFECINSFFTSFVIFVMFTDYYEKDPQSFNDIQEEIKKQYLNTKTIGINLGSKFYVEDKPAKYGI